ncbi:unnamed protein product, partial [Allacma fusca]
PSRATKFYHIQDHDYFTNIAY